VENGGERGVIKGGEVRGRERGKLKSFELDHAIFKL